MAFELVTDAERSLAPFEAPEPAALGRGSAARPNTSANRNLSPLCREATHANLVLGMRRAIHLVDANAAAPTRDVSRLVRLALRFATLAGRTTTASQAGVARIDGLAVHMKASLDVTGKRVRSMAPARPAAQQGQSARSTNQRRSLLSGGNRAPVQRASRVPLLNGLCHAASDLAAAGADTHVGVYELGEAIWSVLEADAPMQAARMARHLSVRLASFGYLMPVSDGRAAVKAAMASSEDTEGMAQSLLIELVTRLSHRDEDVPKAAMMVLTEG